MDNFRFLEGNSLWIIVIIIFLLLVFCGNGCNSGCGCDGLSNLFGGCGNNSWLWIIIILVVLYFLCNDNCGIFRNELQ